MSKSKVILLILITVVVLVVGSWGLNFISRQNLTETIVPAGVSGIYGVSNGKIYYRVGSSLLVKDIQRKNIETLSNQLNTASISPSNVELFYREMNNYVINGFQLNLQSGDSNEFKDIANAIWCNSELYLVYTQTSSGYTIKNSKGETYYENVPTSDIFCQGKELVYAGSDLSEAEEGGTLTLKYLTQGKDSISIEDQASPLLQNGGRLSYFNSEGNLVLADASGNTKIPLRTTQAITTQYGVGEVYVVNSPSDDSERIDIYQVDLATKNFSQLKSYKTTKALNPSKADLDNSIAFESDGYLYFMAGTSIVRAKL